MNFPSVLFRACILMGICFPSFGQLPLKNSEKPLQIPTYEGSGQAMHPCIIDFRSEYGKDSWGGYRFWMVMTPYPFIDKDVENPSIVASRDGINWVVPVGIREPLVFSEPPFNNADPDMIFNAETNQLWVYYNSGGRIPHTTLWHLIRIDENMNSSEPQLLMKVPPKGFDSSVVSTCIWKETPARWHMWGVTIGMHQQFVYRFSADGIHWGKFEVCRDSAGADPFALKGMRPWHASCKPNYKEQRVEFLVASRTDTAFYIPQCTASNVTYAECPMDNPALITLPLGSPVLVHSSSGWDNKRIYRSTFTREDLHYGYKYHIWYSGSDSLNHWGTGYVEGFLGTDNTNDLAPPGKSISRLTDLPAPGKYLLKIKIPKSIHSATLELYNQYGLMIRKYPLSAGSNKVELDLVALPEGKYIYIILKDDKFVEGGLIRK